MRVFSAKPHQSAFIARESELLVPIPDGVSSEQASLTYLTELGVAALRHARYEAGESVAVVGLGVIGLATCGIARVMGATVYAVANSQSRAEAALRVGAQRAYVVGRDGLPENIDLAVLTANAWDAYRTSVDLVRYGGRITILGFPGRAQPPAPFNPLDMQWMYGKQLTLIGAGFAARTECGPAEIRFNLRRNMEFVLGSMAAGALELGPLITHRFPAHRMVEAYELAKTHSKELIAAVFDWRSTGS
jgi:threonine dehydrogenase-like Zn-dependent dehydrogenase